MLSHEEHFEDASMRKQFGLSSPIEHPIGFQIHSNVQKNYRYVEHQAPLKVSKTFLVLYRVSHLEKRPAFGELIAVFLQPGTPSTLSL